MDLSLCISQIPEVPMQGLWHQGPRTKYQLLDSLKSPVLNMLSKETCGSQYVVAFVDKKLINSQSKKETENLFEPS